MPKFPLLPRLSDAGIAHVVSGQWADAMGTAEAGDFLKRLADGLAVSSDFRAIDSIDSIPDVWARPILFRMALFGSQGFDKSLHKKVRGEWRALLAMLALQDMRHLDLTVDEVHLNNDGGLGQTLSMLAPQDSASASGTSAKGNWGDIYVISCNGALLAITSPTTLVAAVADYSAAIKDMGEPWTIDGNSDGKQLMDPLDHLMDNELSGLHLWLTELKNNLSNFIPSDVKKDNETWRGLSQALDEYIQDVESKVGGTFEPTGNLVAAGRNMHIGLGKFMDKMVAAPASFITGSGAIAGSAVLLKTGPDRAAANQLLIVSPEMLDFIATSHGLKKSKIVVWPGITANDIRNGSLTGGYSVINGVSLGNAQWRRPEEFFTEHMAVQAGDKALPGTLSVPGSDILSQDDMSLILPLKAEILEYFTPQEIMHRIHVDKVGSNISVQFTFPLSGINGHGFEYKVEKSYPMQEVLFLTTSVPVVEIWPNFKRPGWQRYYLYYENDDAQNSTKGTGCDFFYVYPWAYGNNIAGDTPIQGLMNLYTARLSGFPDALVCTVNRSMGGSAQPIDVGLLLLKSPPEVSPQMGTNWQIGIDFGTSSTMIYYRNGSRTPQPLVLQPNLFQVTKSELLRLQTYRNFIPSSVTQRDGSFLSIFQLLNGSRLHNNNPQILPLQDGNVFRLPSAEGAEAQDFRDKGEQMDANLKWKDDMVGRLKVGAYIKQICMQIMAEAAQNNVGTITWNFSYPTAFSADQAMTFQLACRNAVRDVIQDSGFPDGATPENWPESKASAYYFNRLGGNAFADGAICLDIGAGTTDVSVISGETAKIVYHTSLQFAGRYMFRSIYKNYKLIAPNLNLDVNDQEQLDTLIDADMREHSAEYLSALPNKSGQADVQKMLQLAQYAMAGIFYYLGNLLGILHGKGIFEGDTVPDIYIGGNGSRIFYWICGGEFNDDNVYISVFRDMLLQTSGLSAGYGFQFILSDTPKIEVASGMIEDRPNNNDEFFNALGPAKAIFGENLGNDPLMASAVLAGDKFKAQDKEHPKTDFISAYDISRGIRIDRIDELGIFTEKFNASPYIWSKKQRIKIDQSQLARVYKKVKGAYTDRKGHDPDEIFVEPIFILELKKFMEILL